MISTTILLLGEHPRLTELLGTSTRFHVLHAPPANPGAELPALVAVSNSGPAIAAAAILRFDRAYDDIAFVALGPQAHVTHHQGTPAMVFDDCFDPGAVAPEVFFARIDSALNGAAARASANRRSRMMQDLDDALRAAPTPARMTLDAACLLGETLGVNRCAYADVEPDQNTFNLTGNYTEGVASIVGRYTFAQFGQECLRLMRAGQPYVVDDTDTDVRTEAVRASYRATDIGAVICVPLMKNGRFVAAMAVHQKVPRAWQMDEVKLLLAVADRCWESIQRTRIERELAAKDARYRALVETVSAVVWHTDEHGSVSTDNPSWGAFTGQSFEQYAGFGWLEVIHPHDQRQTKNTWLAAIATRTPFESSYRLRRHDGQYRHMMVRGVQIEAEDGITSWLGNCVDVSETRLAEQRLHEASTRLQFTLDSAQIAGWDLDLDEQVCTRSELHDQLFGYQEPLAQWSVETLFEHIHPDDANAVRDGFERSVASGREWQFECRVVWPDTSVHWVWGSGYHYQEPGTDKRRMLGIVYDVTARKESELALREADRRKDEFLAMLAHELRNPLAPIAAAAELLKLYLTDSPKLAQASAVIVRQVRHMTGLIDDLLDVSRVTRGLVKIERRPCDLNRVIELAVEQTRAAIGAREHELQLQLRPDTPMLMGDEARLVQVLANLLNNAAKYTPPGGRIIVRIDFDDKHVVCTVSDNGVGMSHDFMQRAFDLFTQADVGLARSSGGLGLGLALVRSLVHMHEGVVSVHSDGIGLGSQFSITLPRAHRVGAPSGYSSQSIGSSDMKSTMPRRQ